MDRPLCGLGHHPFLTLQALSRIDTLSANHDHTILIGEVSQEDNHGRA